MTTIDPTDYVEVAEGVESLKFANAKQQAKFELGVCMAVYKWEELTTAVDNSWGGPKSADKRDWISGIVIDLFDEKVVDIQLIEETLLYAMVDEFDTEIDNDSALEIAALVMKLYKGVAMGDASGVDVLYARWQEKQSSRVVNKVEVGADPNNPDADDSDDSDDDEDDVPELEDDAMEIDDQPQGPVVDDDGFELVQKKGRRR